MYSYEERMRAVRLFVKYDKSCMAVINELEYPSRVQLMSWYREYEKDGDLAMRGGTAINLFMLDIPRLSVDIDISYVGALAREEMLRERPFIECDIARAATASPEAQWKLANLKKMKR